MKKTKSKSTIANIALILVLTFAAASIPYLPAVNAIDLETNAYLTVTPNPVGVGQKLMIVMWLNLIPPKAVSTGGDPYRGYEIIIEKPDGTIQTLGPFDSDPIAQQYTTYTPDQLGTYTFQFSFPGQIMYGDYYEPSTSRKVEVTVQQEQILEWLGSELPTDYWERPIYAENREWYSISGNWIMPSYNASGPFNPYTTAPNSPHIVWTKEIAFGGLVGGEFGTKDYYSGITYEPKFLPPIIMQGRIYYAATDNPFYGYTCLDLRTGEELWWHNTTGDWLVHSAGGNYMPNYKLSPITHGQLYDYESPNQHGIIPYIWSLGTHSWSIGPSYNMYDAYSGNWILKIENASSAMGQMVTYSPKGDILVYILDGANNWLAMWNSSKNIPVAGESGSAAWAWRPPTGATLDWKDGIEWNVTVPDRVGTPHIVSLSDDVIVASSATTLSKWDNVTYTGYSAKTGEELWFSEHKTTQGSGRFYMEQCQGEGVFIRYDKEKLQFYAYNVTTGDLIWGPTEPTDNDWDMYTLSSVIAYGKLYTASFGGRVYCFDLKTGKRLWTYYTGSSGYETVYGHWPFSYVALSIADGKVYATTGEHSPSTPMWRGSKLYCIDAETGDEIWKMSGWYGGASCSAGATGPAIADGYLVAHNVYDHQIYCYGKGPTKTAVTGPEAVQPLGTSILLKGWVTDESEGTKQGESAVFYPDGVPAMSDEYMTGWMEYLYMQQPKPTDAEGVEVVITTFDPNGNTYELGRATTDMSGSFGCVVDPPVPGLYKIIATFEGSESYYLSSAVTYISVEESPSAGQQLEPELAGPTQAAEAPFIATDVIVLLAAVVFAVIALAGFFVFRKQR